MKLFEFFLDVGDYKSYVRIELFFYWTLEKNVLLPLASFAWRQVGKKIVVNAFISSKIWYKSHYYDHLWDC